MITVFDLVGFSIGAFGTALAAVSEARRVKQERALKRLEDGLRQQSGSISSLHLADKIHEWGLLDLVEHRPSDDVIRSAMKESAEIHITCQVDSSDWTEHFGKEIRTFLRDGDKLVLNVPDIGNREVRSELRERFSEDRTGDLQRLVSEFTDLQASEFGAKVTVNRMPICPAYTSVLFVHKNEDMSTGYIRLYANRMHLARDLPTLYIKSKGKLWDFVRHDLEIVEAR
jgi:hypothetical protein